jgi:hypothetical protein
MLNVKKHELRKIYKKHYNFYKAIDGSGFIYSCRLILFYAVECGLKFLLLESIRKNDTESLFKQSGFEILASNGHDIKEMLKLLKIEARFSLPRITCQDERYIEPRDFHLMWRYGIELESKDADKDGVDCLIQIAAWLETKI